MMSKIKDIAISALAIIGAVFYMLFKRNSARADKAEAQKEQYKDAVTENIKEIERMKKVEKIKDDVNTTTDDAIFDELRAYNRDGNKD